MEHFLRALESEVALSRAGSRNDPQYELFRGVDEHPRRYSRPGQPLDPSTDRIPRCFGDLGSFERAGVAPGGVTVDPLQPDRSVGNRGVEFGRSREAAQTPFFLIPAAPEDPRASGIVGGELADLRKRFVERIGVRKV